MKKLNYTISKQAMISILAAAIFEINKNWNDYSDLTKKNIDNLLKQILIMDEDYINIKSFNIKQYKNENN